MRAGEKQARTAADYGRWAENERRERERERNWDRPPYDELRPAACFSERRPTPRERAANRPRARPDENPVESRFEHRMRELGGRPEYYRSLRMYHVRFGDRGLDLRAHTVQPPGSQRRLEISHRGRNHRP